MGSKGIVWRHPAAHGAAAAKPIGDTIRVSDARKSRRRPVQVKVAQEILLVMKKITFVPLVADACGFAGATS